MPSKEAGLRKRRAHHRHLNPLAHVRDGLLHRPPQYLRSLLLQSLVLWGEPVHTLPDVAGLAPWGVRVDDVLALGSHRRVQRARNGHKHNVLRGVHARVPVVHYNVVDLQVVGQAGGVNAQVQVHEALTLGGRLLLLHPLLRQRSVGHELERVPHGGVGNHRLAGKYLGPSAQRHAGRSSVLHNHLLHVRAQLQPAPVLLQPAHQAIDHGFRPPLGELEHGVGAEPVVKHEADLRGQGA
mmetsp:Transcript_38038/g.72923  ORF Transcript_38038/g.72923 Transcript_38038/m.72923 type:complete len:239 (+) Transcript_38038:505-1221(+)